jgi:fucose 4-O-acetylase-like acetyltransferase
MNGEGDVVGDQPVVQGPAGGRAFRIVSAILGVLLVALSVPFAIVAIVSDDPSQTIHRFHTTGGSVPSLVLAAALLVLAWRPDAVAAMQLFVAGAIVSALVGLVSGDFFTGLLFVGAVLAAILLALYPRRGEVWRIARPRIALLAVGVLAAVPAIAYALTQASLQRHAIPGDPHGDAHHYSGAAVAAVALPATVLVAAFGGAGRRIVGWIGAAALVLFGLSGLAFSSYVSAPDPVWSWASIAAGVVVAVATEVGARSAGSDRT